MDISLSSRPHFFAPASPSEATKISLAASNTVYTYHCLCTHLLLATTTPLPSLPTRQNSLDKAHMMPLPPPPTKVTTATKHINNHAPNDHYGLLLSTKLVHTPEMLCTDAGFEKRYLQKCGRCALTVGYQLDWAQFQDEEKKKVGRRDDIVFLLPDGFVTTRDMVLGKSADAGAQKFGVVTEMVAEVKA
ncbi:hypothetical protein K504DRAFT_369605 [Pleomassaria siparia CBS 279.74]|uniref:STEEP1 domain-containing protein n=1 Tax=Pleomassaria siparia CBS 279.74 TaxID=1314801 RepID=A0A6G1KMX3_9PLEO|nr:hypothetical protein K504DRAFT_369605 [Pleomassaria siparia CBS 279.74]